MIIKKLTFILVLILFGASGLLSGCLSVYDKMKLELSVEEIELLLPLSTDEAPVDTQPDGDEQIVEDEILGEDTQIFTATVSKVPKNVLTGVTYQTTNDSIILVEQIKKEEGKTTLKVTGLRPGQTQLIIKTLEGNKQEAISINVIKRLEDIELNTNYKLAAAVGQDVNINTAQAINFYPFNTNQKDVVYTLEGQVEGVTVTEAGKITVTEKTVNEVSIVATSVADESKQVVLQVAIIQPILADDFVITTQTRKDELAQLIEDGGVTEGFSLEVTSLLMSNNHAAANQEQLIIEIDTSEAYNLVVTSSIPDRVEILSIQENSVFIKANNLGDATITVRAEIVGYENYYVTKTVGVTVVNLATSVLINDFSTTRNFEVFSNYNGLFGRELNIKTGPVSAYYKQIKLNVEEDDVDKITIRYSDGTAITGEEINNIILPMGMFIYVEANYLSASQDPLIALEENTVEINFVANYMLAEELWATSTAILNLTQGAEDIVMPDDLSLKKGLNSVDYPNVSFNILPANVTGANLRLEVENTSIARCELQTGNIYKIIALNQGVTTIWATTSNGIRKSMQVEVYVELEGMALQIQSPETNYNIVDVSYNTAPGSYETLIDATVAVGAGIQINRSLYPSNTSTQSTTYSSSNTAIISVNNSGYFVAKGLGSATITATVVTKQFNDSKTSSLVTTQKSFVVNTYVPINDISLNEMQIEIYEQNSLSYFDLANGLGEYELSVNINPANATFNQQNIVWTSSHPYINVEAGVITANIPNDVILPNNIFRATVTASIVEYGRYYAKTALVTIRRSVKVNEITVFNVPKGYVYFDIRNGITPEDKQQISVQTYPYNATNSNIRYLYVQDAQDENEQAVFEISADGVIIPKRAGIATLVIATEDSFSNEFNYSRYKEIIVKVADGLTEQTALEISTSSELLAIDTVNELSLHYVLANNIDLTNQTYTPIGIIGGTVYEFTGSINGRFVYSTISRQYKIVGLRLNTNTANLDSYLGLVAVNSGALKNLDIQISNFNASATNNQANSNSYFAGVAAINNGLIENVSVNVFESNINLTAQNSYVAIMAAVNNGDIINAITYGNLEVKQAVGLSVTPIVFVGGIAGLNNLDAVIEGEYIPANRVPEGETEEIVYTNKYQKEGMNSFAKIDTSLLTNINNASGLAVGKNLGTIANVATDGEIVGLNNIGGLIGININLVENSYSSSKVTGVENVGGLIGKTASEGVLSPQIINNAVEIYDRQLNTQEATTYITGVNNVGGLIGYAQDLNVFAYNYVNSYYLRELGVNYKGDLVINLEDQTNNYYAGGLIGFVQDTQAILTKNYANLTIVAVEPQTTVNTPTIYAGGLFGAISGNFDLNNSYSKGEINLPAQNSFAGGLIGFVTNADNSAVDYVYSSATLTANIIEQTTAFISVGSAVNATNTDYTIWDLTESVVWYLNAEINEGLPALYNYQGNLLINKAPESITVTVKDQDIVVDSSDNSISFNHLKVNNNRAIVLLSDVEYQISSLIETYPASSRYYVSTMDTNIVQILDKGKIRLLQEGTATITVSSLLNANIFATFELAVIKGFTNFSLSQTQNVETGQLTLQDLIQIKLNESIMLFSQLTNDNYSVTNNSGVIYSATTSDFTVNNLPLDATLANVANHILTGISSTEVDENILVTATPYISVLFNGELQQVQFTSLRKQFYVSVFEGATSITTSVASASIGLMQELNLGVYVTTDKAVEDILVEYGDLDGEIDDKISNYVSVEFLNSEKVFPDDIENNEYLYNFVVKANPIFLEVSSGSGNFKSAKTGNITFIPASNTQLSTTFNITMTPEDLLRIDMAHYPVGETKIEVGKPIYYPQELPNSTIVPGQAGILKVNLFPEYANIDYYEIVSSTTSLGQFVSFEQVALTTDGENSIYYSAITPSPALIDFGTTLSLISTADKTGVQIQYGFNGNIFIKTLIASAVKKGTIFTLTITGYRIDEFGVAQPNLTKAIQLTADTLSGVSLSYNGGLTNEVARGTTVPIQIYVSDDYSGELQDPVVTINRQSGVDSFFEDYDINGNPITVTNLAVYSARVKKENGQYYLIVGPAIPGGTEITITAKVKRVINGVEQVKEASITLKVVNYIVEGILVDRVSLTQSNTLKMYVDGIYQLKAKLQTKMFDYQTIDDYMLDEANAQDLQTIFENIEEELIAKEHTISRNLKTWYQRTSTGSSYTDTSLEVNVYENFAITTVREEGPEYDYDYEGQDDIFILAKRISTTTSLTAKVEYYYTNNGSIQIVNLINGTYVKYPQYASDAGEIVPEDYVNKIKITDFNFSLNIVSNSTEDKPVPIYTVQELKNMQPGVDYILLKEDEKTPYILENWVPLNTAIKSLDGNGRTIEIKSFASNSTVGTYNFGLFGTVNQATVLKNIVVDIAGLSMSSPIINATEFTAVNFGFIAGVNYGTITNSDVVNSAYAGQTIVLNTQTGSATTFGGFVGYNSGGYITNSRVGKTEYSTFYKDFYPISLQARGNVAGFVGYNSGVITSSYAANLTLKNSSTSIQNSKTAGFVAVNANSGRISLSFVEGVKDRFTEDIFGIKIIKIPNTLIENTVIQGGGLDAAGTIGGFVHENQGKITDAYANIPITTQSRSAGFVYKNMQSGQVNNAYSASKIIESTTANLPFIGSDNLEQLLYEGTLTNTYYLANVNYFTTQFAGEYPAIAVQIENFGKINSFNGFGFLTDVAYQQYGSWMMVAEADNSGRPVIPSALETIVSKRVLASTKVVGNTIVDYNYSVAPYTDEKGQGNNPIMVANARQFLEAMTWEFYLDQDLDSAITTIGINRNKIKLIKDIDFSQIVNDIELQKLQSITFAGILDGNGMSLNNVRVLSSVTGQEIQESFGMFYKIGFNDEDYLINKKETTGVKTLVKNLNINVAEISATDSIRVGVLSGLISNSVIVNVNISGEQITVQGRNLVGGLAGEIVGDSKIINVTSSVSVSSEYRTIGDYLYYNEYDELNEYNEEGNNLVAKNHFSYVGGIAGAIDLYLINEDGEKQLDIDWEIASPNVIDLKTTGDIKIRGENSGGVIGYVGQYTYVRNALFELYNVENSTQAITGFNLAGGVVAENSGKIEYVRIEHPLEFQENTIDKTNARIKIGYQNLFDETSNYTGGIVGYNNRGIIANSYSRVDIVNDEIKVAGGLVGINYGGIIDKVYATGHIAISNDLITGQVIGGLIGVVSENSLESVEVVLPEHSILNINDAFAVNNWQLSAYSNVDEATGSWLNQQGIVDANKFIGAFIGHLENMDLIASEEAYYINEVFQTLTGDIKKQLNEIGNGHTVDGINAIIPNEGDTQFEAITNSDVKQEKYLRLVQSLLWTIDNVRFPKLLFSNLESISEVYDEAGLINALKYNKSSTVIVKNNIYLSKNWEPVSFRGHLMGDSSLTGYVPTIYNLNIDTSNLSTVPASVAFLSNLQGGSISNINFEVGGQQNVTWNGDYANGIIATSKDINSATSILVATANNSAIENVIITLNNEDINFSASSQYFGLIVAKADTVNVTNITFIQRQDANINIQITQDAQSDYEEGVFIGAAIGYIEVSTLIKNISISALSFDIKAISTLYAGGMIGKFDAGEAINITANNISLYIEGESNIYAGGIIGAANGVDLSSETNTTYTTYATGDITVYSGQATDYLSTYVGGIVGLINGGKITKVYATGALYVSSFYGTTKGIDFLYIGGIAGAINGGNGIWNSYYSNDDDISIDAPASDDAVRIGGVAGSVENALLNNTYAIANISAINKKGTTYLGGLAGQLITGSSVQLSYAKVNIESATQSTIYLGGLIGSATEGGNIDQAYSQGNINTSNIGQNVYAGGLIGSNGLTVTNVFSAVNLNIISIQNQFVGGLIGENAGTVNNAYSYGTVYSSINTSTNVNPVVGNNIVNVGSTVIFNKDLVGLTDRFNNFGAVGYTQAQLISTTNYVSSIWTSQSNTYPYLKNLAAPDTNLGSMMKPIEIRTAIQFATINDSDKYYIQKADFTYDVNVRGQIANFSGKYNGNGFTINYTQSGTMSLNIGLFNTIASKGLVANLKINAFITLASSSTDSYNVGGLATHNLGIIYKSYVSTIINNGESLELKTSTIGGLVAFNRNLIENSFAQVNLNVKFYERAYVGGLVGYTDSNNAVINTSAATGRLEVEGLTAGVTNTAIVAGLVAVLTNKIKNSYSSVLVINKPNLVKGGLYGIGYSLNVENSYYDVLANNAVSKTGEQAKATAYMTSDAFVNQLSLDGRFNGVWTRNKTINYGCPYPSYLPTSYASSPLKSGDGTYASPYLINHAGRLDWIRTQLTNAAYFKQTENIDLEKFNSLNGQFESIGNIVSTSNNYNRYAGLSYVSFIGIYYGQNYTINNLTQTFDGSALTYGGLFRVLEGGAMGSYKYGYVYNVGLINVNIKINSSATMQQAFLGGIASAAFNTRIQNSYVIGNIEDARNKKMDEHKIIMIGGLIGFVNSSDIENSYANTNITASYGSIGGLIGDISNSNLKNSYHDGNINVSSYWGADKNKYLIGGVAGKVSNSNLFNVENFGSIDVSAITMEQDIVRWNYFTFNSTILTSNEGTGGIAGSIQNGSLIHVINNASINFIGYNQSSDNNIGGIAGKSLYINEIESICNKGEINVIYAAGKVASMAYSSNIGGLIGRAQIDEEFVMRYSSNLANITAKSYYETLPLDVQLDNAGYEISDAQTAQVVRVGGIIGRVVLYENVLPNLSYVYNEGNLDVSGPLDVFVGGVVGDSKLNIVSSYNKGNISVKSATDYDKVEEKYIYVGGIAGNSQIGAKIEKSFNSGAINIVAAALPVGSETVSSIFVGGVAGVMIEAVYKEVYNTGRINFDNFTAPLKNLIIAGGLVGVINGNDKYNYEKEVYNTAYIWDSYNTGRINLLGEIGLKVAGGIVGMTVNAILYNCYNSAIIEIKNNAYPYFVVINGIIGLEGDDSSIITCYYRDRYIIDGVDKTFEGGLLLSDLQRPLTYEGNGWDFVTRWKEPILAYSTPTLRRVPVSISIEDGPAAEPTVDLTTLQLTAKPVPSVSLGSGSGGEIGGDDPINEIS